MGFEDCLGGARLLDKAKVQLKQTRLHPQHLSWPLYKFSFEFFWLKLFWMCFQLLCSMFSITYTCFIRCQFSANVFKIQHFVGLDRLFLTTCSTNKTLVMNEELHKCDYLRTIITDHKHPIFRSDMIHRLYCIFTRLLRNTSYFSLKADKNTRECSVLSFPLEIIWSQEQNIKTSIKHGQSNWVSVITLSWFIEAQFKLSVQWNAASFGADVGNSFVSSFQLEFQPVFALLCSHFFCFVFFWGIVIQKATSVWA